MKGPRQNESNSRSDSGGNAGNIENASIPTALFHKLKNLKAHRVAFKEQNQSINKYVFSSMEPPKINKLF